MSEKSIPVSSVFAGATPCGLPRHVLRDGNVMLDRVVNTKLGTVADMTVEIHKASVEVLPHLGTPLEKAAMRFHADSAGHASITPEGGVGQLPVNGKPAWPGAPFAAPPVPSEPDDAVVLRFGRPFSWTSSSTHTAGTTLRPVSTW